ncbi:uncharacterized protein LOC126902726 isoform X2 [Daktulosphaira vitifoliae]|uniref:uncharacterized protein LOC126902726 isoform X2 n=1 Tax=Daktulosphaira vitifoliae TaxID=58002 RepID=UPI0021A9CB39|nr:uncharacterized protein LOC126902726 isoform X2 [Daktulosphaira vitifoliae]
MYFYIFIVMYLTRSFSNAYLFEFSPFLRKDLKFNQSAWEKLEAIFDSNKHNIEGMNFEIFRALMCPFKPVHNLNENDIKILFTNENEIDEDGFMNFAQFLKRILEVTKKVEHTLKIIHEYHVNQDGKMTKQTFIEALKLLNMVITPEDAEKAIKKDAFRNMYAMIYYKVLNDVKDSILNQLGVVIHW